MGYELRPGTLTEHDLSDGRQICVWCKGPTTRIGRDRLPRHGWCEPYNRRPPIWTRTANNPIVPGLPAEGDASPEKTFLKKYKVKVKAEPKPKKKRGKKK